MKIVLYPFIGETNKYIDFISTGLKNKGHEIVRINKFFSHYNSVKIIHFNWYEIIFSRSDFFKKVIKILLFRSLGKKIVFTIHNKLPHENHYATLQKIFFRFLSISSDKIIIHSEESKLLFESEKIQRKIVYLPHPNYIDLYGPLKINSSKIEDEPLKLLFIGQVRPYKNIELLIECCKSFESQINLTIAGKISDREYEAIIKKMANQKMILDLKFIDDGKLIEYLRKNDLVILPYDIKSSLNSGTVLLSFSYGRTVICPDIGTIKDIKDKRFILNYNYSNNEEHKDVLMQIIEKAIELHKHQHNIFDEWGSEMRQYAIKFHSQEYFINKLNNIYKGLVE